MLRPAAAPNGSRAAKANENETKQPESNQTARPFDLAAAPSHTREIRPHNRCVVACLRSSPYTGDLFVVVREKNSKLLVIFAY